MKRKIMVINKPEDLDKIRCLKGVDTLVLVFTKMVDLIGNKNFKPIDASNMNVIIYGRNHSLNNLFINRPKEKFNGLFSKVKNLYVNGLSMYETYIVGEEVNGALAGEVSEKLTVRNSYVDIFINGDAICGGLTGIAGDIDVSNTSITCIASGRGCLGGIAGMADTYETDESTISVSKLFDSYSSIASDTSTNPDIGYLSSRENDKINNDLIIALQHQPVQCKNEEMKVLSMLLKK